MSVVTFLDAGVLIAAAYDTSPRGDRARAAIFDPTREFVASHLLVLETIPMPTHYKEAKVLAFYKGYFDTLVKQWVSNDDILGRALGIASLYGLKAMDACHITAAIQAGAEFITTEKDTRPMFRCTQVSMISIA